MKHKDKINNDPTKREEYLRKERLRWKKRCDTAEIKAINKLLESDKRQKRK